MGFNLFKNALMTLMCLFIKTFIQPRPQGSFCFPAEIFILLLRFLAVIFLFDVPIARFDSVLIPLHKYQKSKN